MGLPYEADPTPSVVLPEMTPACRVSIGRRSAVLGIFIQDYEEKFYK